MARRRKGRKDEIAAPLFPIFTPSFPRKRESRGLGTAFVYLLPLNFGLLQPRELMSTRPTLRHSRFRGNDGGLQPSLPPEIRYKYQPADPLSLYGRGLG